jgi:energy-coupling factor transport system substrate-specific component
MDVVMGFWFVASIVAAAIIRKPGVAFRRVLAGGGDPARQPGRAASPLGAVQGAGAEVVFAATPGEILLAVLMAAGVGVAVFSFAYTWIRTCNLLQLAC